MKDIISIVEEGSPHFSLGKGLVEYGQIMPLAFKLTRRTIEKLNEREDNGFCSKFIEGITISNYIAKHVHE